MVRKLITGSLIAALMAGTAGADTLREALVSAYQTNPTLTAQRETLKATDANVAIAKAIRSGFTSEVPNASSKSWGYVRVPIQLPNGAGIVGESVSGFDAATRAATSFQSRPKWAISAEFTGGPRTWLSRAAPVFKMIWLVIGSRNVPAARPSQKSSGW